MLSKKVIHETGPHSGGTGGGTPILPPHGGDGGGNEHDFFRNAGEPSPRSYSAALKVGLVAIVMFFVTLACAFLTLRHVSPAWVVVPLPKILWANTVILIASSVTLERARKRLSREDVAGFRTLWRVATALGIVFLLGQFVAWIQLVREGVYVASSQASSFFYIFTAVHGLHLVGGIAALLYVLLRGLRKTEASLTLLVGISSYYWHFMDVLWILLFALLYFGK